MNFSRPVKDPNGGKRSWSIHISWYISTEPKCASPSYISALYTLERTHHTTHVHYPHTHASLSIKLNSNQSSQSAHSSRDYVNEYRPIQANTTRPHTVFESRHTNEKRFRFSAKFEQTHTRAQSHTPADFSHLLAHSPIERGFTGEPNRLGPTRFWYSHGQTRRAICTRTTNTANVLTVPQSDAILYGGGGGGLWDVSIFRTHAGKMIEWHTELTEARRRVTLLCRNTTKRRSGRNIRCTCSYRTRTHTNTTTTWPEYGSISNTRRFFLPKRGYCI